jgi:hypothetical protein
LNGSRLRDGFSASLSHGCDLLNGVNTCFWADGAVNEEGWQKDVWQKDEVMAPYFCHPSFCQPMVSLKVVL